MKACLRFLAFLLIFHALYYFLMRPAFLLYTQIDERALSRLLWHNQDSALFLIKTQNTSYADCFAMQALYQKAPMPPVFASLHLAQCFWQHKDPIRAKRVISAYLTQTDTQNSEIAIDAIYADVLLNYLSENRLTETDLARLFNVLKTDSTHIGALQLLLTDSLTQQDSSAPRFYQALENALADKPNLLQEPAFKTHLTALQARLSRQYYQQTDPKQPSSQAPNLPHD